MTRTSAALLCAAVLLTACGQGRASGPPTAAEPSETATTAATDAATESTAQRIVSLSPTATEILFAIDAGDEVVAVDDQSTYPEQAPRTDLSGFEPNLEAIAEYDPDLVVIGFAPEDFVPAMERLGIEVLQQDAAVTLDDTYDQIRELGAVTRHEAEADALVEDMKAEIDELVAQVPDRERQPTYYHELDNTLFTVTSQTFVGSLYDLAGLRNVADPADAKGQSGGYPQLSREFLVDADPDYVFLADTKCCGESAETFAKRPGFGQLTAVRNDKVVELDDDIASRWGPRVVDFLRTIIDATADAKASALVPTMS